MRKYFACCLFLIIVASRVHAQSNNNLDILQSLQKLNTIGSVLYIAAHPDDENTSLLTYLSKEKKMRTAYLSITRGDGGQNLIGKEQGEALGLIRTRELLGARKIDGAEQFFTRAFDFGYSKTPEETFIFWNKDSILADMVWVVRKFKPDVMICCFPTTGEGGHGHHTASAILALEAFDAAADPSKFSWQLKYTEVWKAKRIFWNTFNFGSANTTSSNQLKFDINVYNPLTGKSYGEIAAESRSMHKSQGFGSTKDRGQSLEYFKLLKGDSCKTDLLEKIDLTWKRITKTNKIQCLINQCIAQYDPNNPSKIVSTLVQLHKEINALDEKNTTIKYWKKIKLAETEALIESCMGLWLECTAEDFIVIPGKDITLKFEALNRSNIKANLRSVNFGTTDTIIQKSLNNNKLLSTKYNLKIPANAAYSNPYWLNKKHSIGAFDIEDKTLIGKPENDPSLSITYNIEIEGSIFNFTKQIVYKSTDPIKGEVYRSLEILPPITVNFTQNVLVFTQSQSKNITLLIKANTDNINGKIIINAPIGYKIEIKNPHFNLAKKDDETTIQATITASKNATLGNLAASVLMNGNSYNKSIKRIAYEHIPSQFILSDASIKIATIDLKKEDIKIGYISGAGDEVPDCLKQVGLQVTELNDNILENEDISKYNAIVTGVRAYNTNKRLEVYHKKLMDYVKNGGNLIVQYNTNNPIAPLKTEIGPYPFTISRERVTDENAEMKILHPEHAALNVPNKIDTHDFENWIQERGLYFAIAYDKNYQSLFSVKDPNEKASEGSLIVASYGKGNFVYTGLAFFRELPAGVSGAYRLFVNLLSLPQH